MKQKKCKQCSELFTPFNSIMSACGVKCALKLAEKKTKDNYKKETRQLKKKFRDNDRSTQTKLAQTAFNAWIRARDESQPCISCQRFHGGQYHAGHFYTTASKPELRYEPRNCFKQCSACNNHLSGNILEYRKNLSTRLSDDDIEWLEGHHPPAHRSVDDLIAIKELYKRKLKEGDFTNE